MLSASELLSQVLILSANNFNAFFFVLDKKASIEMEM
jgi:hypothetical protein